MNQKLSWDQSLVKKYSSSNHFKLLNQLRNEVIKYPLNKNKKEKNNLTKESTNDIKNNDINLISEKVPLTSNSNYIKDLNINKSIVSFNNSKDFSIYNNIKYEKQNKIIEQRNSSDQLSFSTFKDRLNEIDLK